MFEYGWTKTESMVKRKREANLGRGRRGNKRSRRRSSGGVRQVHRGIDVPTIQPS